MIKKVLQDYLAKKDPEPNLAIKIETIDVVNELELMKTLGFEEKGEYYVISRGNARKAIETLSLETHWRFETDRIFGLLDMERASG